MQLLRGGKSWKRARVLVADDDPIMRSLVRANLDGRVATLAEASDGQEAWDMLLRGSYELALIDLSMPGMDGLALIRCIRSHPRTRHLPVVVITSSSDRQAVRDAFEAGATSFMTKPVNWTLFAHQIEYQIHLEQMSAVDRATRQRAEAVARAKDALIAALAARVKEQTRRLVLSSEEALQDLPSDDARGLDFAAGVLSDARAIEDLVGEVLPFVRCMTEQIAVDDKSVSVLRIIEACADGLRPMAREADVRIDVLPIPSALRVCCDEAAIGRALSNLVRNAIEFTRPGTAVRIGIELKEDQALTIFVDDFGPGVDPDIIARALTPLDMRVVCAIDAGEQAALGLPIAKAIAQAHGGTVEVVSRQHAGARASLILPAEIIEAEDAEDAA